MCHCNSAKSLNVFAARSLDPFTRFSPNGLVLGGLETGNVTIDYHLMNSAPGSRHVTLVDSPLGEIVGIDVGPPGFLVPTLDGTLTFAPVGGGRVAGT